MQMDLQQVPKTEKITDETSPNRTPQSTVTCLYQIQMAGNWHNATVLWCKHLMNHSLSLFFSDQTGGIHQSHKVDLKPWLFWSKKGNRSMDLYGCNVEIHWDLRSAKFSGGPEPYADYYVAMISDGEVILLLGDNKKKAYKRTKARPALVEAVLVYKKENVFARKSFATKARFDERGNEHDITVESSASGAKEPEMWISVDGIVVIHVKNLQWKFRGNQTVMVNEQPVQVFWDVHDWIFGSRNGGTGHGLFIFKPGLQEVEDEKVGVDGIRSHLKQTQAFCLFLYAWKIE